MKSLSIGIPCYGAQEAIWWSQLVMNVANMTKTLEIADIIVSDTMSTDHNRNAIVDKFLKSKSEWIFWIDADTVVPIGSVERLMKTGHKIVSGLYYAKHKPHNPVAYYTYNNAYRSIDGGGRTWERGEIIEVDTVGFGCMLTHRSIFEDIKDKYIMKQEKGGGIVLVHKDDIEIGNASEFSGVIGNTLHTPLVDVELDDFKFPYFASHHGRTEDLWWTEKVKRLGHKIYLDTSIECGHIYPKAFDGVEYRKMYGY